MVARIAFTPDELRGYAAKAGLGFQFVIKDAFLFELMDVLAEQDFVLKGGTAINKGYLQGHQRFSEDLDYDTEEDRKTVTNTMRGLGWGVKREFFTKSAIGFLLGYEFAGITDVVKVDLSFGIEGKGERRSVTSDFLPLSKRVTTYRFEDLNFQKERALESRKEWKDLYDLYWMGRLYPDAFRVRNGRALGAALESMRIPKTANSFIPTQKRINLDEAKEALLRWTENG